MLDSDHAGLDDVKKRITEFVAVRKLRQERAGEIEEDSRANGTILTLVGPPGTGKTSIGESIARSLGREFVRISLGGLHDEAKMLAAIAAPTSAPCPDGSSVPCATPRR